MTNIVYPPDLRESIRKYPYLKLKSFRYRERNFVFDGEGKINNIDPKKTAIRNYYLPLPESINNSNVMEWDMNNLQALGIIEGIVSGDSAVKGTAGALDDVAAIGALGIPRLKGLVANPKKQALFAGIQPRTFQFSYTFSPQSLHEAEVLETVIRELTKASLPNLVDGDNNDDDRAAFFQFPDEFELEFINVAGFPKIYNTVCTNIVTNYTPNAVQLLESGHSVSISLSLNFLETELLRKTKPGI